MDDPIRNRPWWKTAIIWGIIALLILATIWVWANVLFGAPSPGLSGWLASEAYLA